MGFAHGFLFNLCHLKMQKYLLSIDGSFFFRCIDGLLGDHILMKYAIPISKIFSWLNILLAFFWQWFTNLYFTKIFITFLCKLCEWSGGCPRASYQILSDTCSGPSNPHQDLCTLYLHKYCSSPCESWCGSDNWHQNKFGTMLIGPSLNPCVIVLYYPNVL